MSQPAAQDAVSDAEPAPATISRIRQHLYMFAMLLDTIGTGMWMPVGLIFFTKAQQLPVEQVGSMLTVGGIFGLVLGPMAGNLVDKWGPGRLLLASNLSSASVFVLYPLVGSAWQIALLAAVLSAATRLFWTANTLHLASTVSGRGLDEVLATQNVIRIVGIGIGAGASGVFAGSVTGLHVLALINAGTFVLAAILIGSVVNLSTPDTKVVGNDSLPKVGWRDIVADRPFLLLCLVQTLFVLCAMSLVGIMPLVALDPLGGPQWLPGASIVVGNVVLALAQKPAVRFSTRTSRLRALLISSITFAVTFLLMAPGTYLDQSLVIPLVLAASALGVVGEALFGPLMTAVANERAPEAVRGRYSALFQTSWGLAVVLAPAVFTGLLALGHAVLWLTACGIALLTIPGLLVLSRKLPAQCLRE